jgi:hypothetical protein
LGNSPTLPEAVFTVSDSMLEGNSAVLNLNYGTNVFEIQADVADSQPYVLTVVRGMTTPDFAMVGGDSGLGDEVVKALPIDNGILYISNEYAEGTKGKIHRSDANMGSIKLMGEWPDVEFTDIAPLPGLVKAYVVAGYDDYARLPYTHGC